VTRNLSTDYDLMQRVAAGDARAFRELSAAHLKAIVTYSFRILGNHAEAEEIAQEVFLRAWQNAVGYRPEARVTTWLHCIAQRLALDVLRKRHGGTLQLDEAEAAPSSNSPAHLLEQKQVALNVQAALAALPARQKMALILSHEQGLSNPEIAEVLEQSVEAVESVLARGRRALRAVLTPNGSNKAAEHVPV
jgi:RNA polymerase sigma-70 factor, ECF subfamily